MHKVVYNGNYGGFELSDKAREFIIKNKNLDLDITDDDYFDYKIFESRHDPVLVKCVEELGEEANGECADLKIKIINSDRYFIDDYDGYETIVTPEMVEQRWIKIK